MRFYAQVRLSLCMIVRDERANLAGCLRSVRGLVDEIVVVDTGSTDGTQALAAEQGAVVIQSEWTHDFSRARNLGLERARGEWILVLDADEELLPKDREALAALIARPRAAPGAFRLLQKSSSDGGRTGMIVPIVRLFPRDPLVRYEWPIHEQVETSLARAGVAIEDTAIEILHRGYADPARNKDKQRRNLAILRRQIEAQAGTALTWYLLGGAHLDLGEAEPALAAYRECGRLAGDEPVGQGAGVRVVGCLVELRRHAEALSLADEIDASGGAHPELSLLRGRCEAALGRADRARVAFESVLRWRDGAFLPPCNLEEVKTKAALALAEHLRAQGDPAGGVAILRAVKTCRAAGQALTAELLTRVAG